ncbi:MAG: SH3 domain-containing protein [Candidatus Coatesbacteria bacterium]|nr:MAG: SH3 domain-containing protein [Candidatus Coatesbacteria bacterium]
MRNHGSTAARVIVFAISILAAASSYAVRVNQVELKLAVALADGAPLYWSISSQDKAFLNARDTVIIHPEETGDAIVNWYRIDEIHNFNTYRPYGRDYLKPCPEFEIMPLEGVVAAVKVNVREYPSTGAKVETTLNGGSIVTVLARTKEQEELEGFDGSHYWYRVRTPEGVTGWIYGALLGLLEPSEAYDFALTLCRQNDPDAALRVIGAAYERFPDSDFYRRSYIYDEPSFGFAPTFNLVAGYAYYRKGDVEASRSYYNAALTYGEKPARAVFDSYHADPGTYAHRDCGYGAATLARVGLGITYARSDPEKAAEYFARAISDSESGISNDVITPAYFDRDIIHNLIGMYETGAVNRKFMDNMGTLISSRCSYDFAPGYFLLDYGEALEKGGNSSEAVVLYERVVEDYPGAYMYMKRFGYTDIPARALWHVMNIRARLGENRDFSAYCSEVAKASDDKRIGFIAYYLAGMALEKAGDAAGASKQYDRAERYYRAGDLVSGDFGPLYEELYGFLTERMAGHPDIYQEEYWFKGEF